MTTGWGDDTKDDKVLIPIRTEEKKEEVPLRYFEYETLEKNKVSAALTAAIGCRDPRGHFEREDGKIVCNDGQKELCAFYRIIMGVSENSKEHRELGVSDAVFEEVGRRVNRA